MDAANIGCFLQQLRKEDNLTQKDIAQLCNVTTQAVSKWERGDSIPDIEILEKLSILYKLSINELVNGQKQELYLDINKRRNIIALTSSVLVFFAYLLNFIQADYPLNQNTSLVFRGYQLIINGLGGGLIVLTWVVFMILISHLILNIFILTKVINQNNRVKNYFVYSGSMGILLTIIGILIGAFIVFPQFIIIISLTVIIVMNYQGQYNISKLVPYLKIKIEMIKTHRKSIKTYHSNKKNKEDVSSYLIRVEDKKKSVVLLKMNVISIAILNALIALTFAYYLMDALLNPLFDGNLVEIILYFVLYSVTWIVAVNDYRYITTIFGKRKLQFLGVLLIAYPAIRVIMDLFGTEFRDGVVVSLMLFVQSIILFVGSYKLSKK